MAIMGFGGGAMIGSPLAVNLMHFYATPTSVGVVPTMITMGIVYFCFMMFGVFAVRVPPVGWLPDGYAPPLKSTGLVTTANVTTDQAPKTPQFWLLWVILCVNVTAGIGILEQASPMIQEMFLTPKAMAGIDPTNTAAVAAAAKETALVAGGFVGLLSLFNMLGRFFWSSLSDYTGRKAVYFIYLLVGPLLYFLIPTAATWAARRSSSASAWSSSPCTAAALPPCRPTCVTFSAPSKSARFTAGSSPLVRRRRARPATGQRHPRIPARPPRGAGRCLRAHHVPDVRPAPHRRAVQFPRRPGPLQPSRQRDRLRAQRLRNPHREEIMTTKPGRSDAPEPSQVPRSAGFLIFSWLWVGLPLAWGVYQTILKSMALFQ